MQIQNTDGYDDHTASLEAEQTEQRKADHIKINLEEDV